MEINYMDTLDSVMLISLTDLGVFLLDTKDTDSRSKSPYCQCESDDLFSLDTELDLLPTWINPKNMSLVVRPEFTDCRPDAFQKNRNNFICKAS